MGPIDARELDRRKLYQKEERLAEKVRKMLEKHLEHRSNLRVYTPDDDPWEAWIWGLGPDFTRPYRGPRPYKLDEWIDRVFAHPDGKIYIYSGSSHVSDAISEEHPSVYQRLVKKGDDPEKNVKDLFRVVKDLQFRENWKKYERMIPKVVKGFRRIEKLTKEVSKKHDARIEFWINERRWGVRAIVDAEGMNEKEKLEAIMKAAKALKDFNHRFHPET